MTFEDNGPVEQLYKLHRYIWFWRPYV